MLSQARRRGLLLRSPLDASKKFNELVEVLAVLAHPYDGQREFAEYAKPPAPEEEVQQTFCGT